MIGASVFFLPIWDQRGQRTRALFLDQTKVLIELDGSTCFGVIHFGQVFFGGLSSDVVSSFNCQRLPNHYEIQQMAFSSRKICGFPPRGLLTFAENAVICAVKRRFPHPRSRENHRRILWRSFRVAVKVRSGQEVGFGLSRSSSRDPSESKFVLMYVLSWGQIWKVWMKHYFGVAGAQLRLGDRVFQTFCKNPCSFQIIMCLRGSIMEYPKSSLYNLPLLSFSLLGLLSTLLQPGPHPLANVSHPSDEEIWFFSFPQEPRFCILVVA